MTHMTDLRTCPCTASGRGRGVGGATGGEARPVLVQSVGGGGVWEGLLEGRHDLSLYRQCSE